jgi:hypothetical protein
MDCKWKIGDKVVCIDNSNGWATPIKCHFKVGGVYTIKDFLMPEKPMYENPYLHIQLEEYPGPEGNGDYWAWLRFRSIDPQTKETDISVFKKLLRPTKVKNGTRLPERV